MGLQKAVKLKKDVRVRMKKGENINDVLEEHNVKPWKPL